MNTEIFKKIGNKIWYARKSIIPALTWRIITTCISIIILYLMTGEIELALQFGGIEFFLKWVLLSYHNEVWRKYFKKKKKLWREGAYKEMESDHNYHNWWE